MRPFHPYVVVVILVSCWKWLGTMGGGRGRGSGRGGGEEGPRETRVVLKQLAAVAFSVTAVLLVGDRPAAATTTISAFAVSGCGRRRAGCKVSDVGSWGSGFVSI